MLLGDGKTHKKAQEDLQLNHSTCQLGNKKHGSCSSKCILVFHVLIRPAKRWANPAQLQCEETWHTIIFIQKNIAEAHSRSFYAGWTVSSVCFWFKIIWPLCYKVILHFCICFLGTNKGFFISIEYDKIHVKCKTKLAGHLPVALFILNSK